MWRRSIRGGLPAGASVLVLSCASGGDGSGPPVAAASASFEVTCHFPCGAVAAQAAAVAEEALGIVAPLMPQGRTARRPLRIHLHSDTTFEALAAEVAEGRFRENLGFTDPSGGVAHVALEDADSGGLTVSSRRRIAHEATHLAAGSVRGGLPRWLGEGLATRVEREVSRARGDFPTRLHDRWLALHLWRSLRLLEADALPSAAAILGDSLELDPANAYAVRSVFFEFLMERRWETLEALLAEAWRAPRARRRGGSAAADAPVPTLGNDALRELDAELRSYIAAVADSVPWAEALSREP